MEFLVNEDTNTLPYNWNHTRDTNEWETYTIQLFILIRTEFLDKVFSFSFWRKSKKNETKWMCSAEWKTWTETETVTHERCYGLFSFWREKKLLILRFKQKKKEEKDEENKFKAWERRNETSGKKSMNLTLERKKKGKFKHWMKWKQV